MHPFEQAVREHGAAVLRVCRATLGAGPDADDAWSETFASALRAWPGLPDDTNVEAWLVRVAQRRCVDLLRARNRLPEPVEDPPVTATATSHEDFATDRIMLWDAVAALPERQRLAVAAHYLAGLSHVETARIIGGSPESVRRAASDGIRRLRVTSTATHEGGPW